MSLTGKPSSVSLPTLPTGVEVASYTTYLEAQQAVDHLSDKAFPVQKVTIVGTDLLLVERITGRLTYARVAGAGAMSGAWFGLMIALLFWLFTPNGDFPILAGVLIGAAFGILFAVVSYAFTGGKRDFTSTSQVVASRYAILCDPEHAGQARQVLTEGGRHGQVRPRASAGAPQQNPYAAPPQSGYGAPQAPPVASRPPAGPVPGGTSAQDEPTDRRGESGPSQFGSRADERPRYGVRLDDVDRDRAAPDRRDHADPGREGADGTTGRE
ncbi:general stress protein [Georgenia subflava]|uniref:general stress protein n=1 Tax=Georgenia subflava TaxID=1622177 RepID=UPI00186AF820|nr:general stress protein [Georgenia subflava]